MDTDTYYRLIRYLDDLTLPADFDTTQLRNFKNKARSYIIKNGILYRRNIRNPQRPMRVIKKNEMEIILRGFHDDPLAGHFGFNETFRAIKEKYFWPQMGDDIKAYVQACDTCQRRKRPIKTEPLHPIKVAKYCIERKDDWDLFIPSALFAYRTMRQNITRYEPFYLTYGRDAVLPIELEVPTYPFEDRSDRGFEDLYFRRLGQLAGNLIDDRQQANENIQHAQKRQVERHNKQIKEHRYQIGEKVLLRNFRAKKLDSKWHGPYYIHDVRPNGTYKLRTLEGKLRKKVVHADQIRSYYERTITN
ncbi:uncharacterized protein LOC112698023 [Rhizophagus irregularis DAOM 181602=DAOM 197198]|nr:uncharacterized protein LOC112698023 [Rhizophagus irregularis DAOM 181602=DAOM 197198]